MADVGQYTESEPTSNLAQDFDEIMAFEPLEVVNWRSDLPEAPDRFWRFLGFVEFWDADPVGSINLEAWRVIRRTPKGCWIAPPFTNSLNEEKLKRFVLNDSRKKHAYPTKKEAFDSFCIRLTKRREYWEREGERLCKLDAIVASEISK